MIFSITNGFIFIPVALSFYGPVDEDDKRQRGDRRNTTEEDSKTPASAVSHARKSTLPNEDGKGILSPEIQIDMDKNKLRQNKINANLMTDEESDILSPNIKSSSKPKQKQQMKGPHRRRLDEAFKE